MKLKIEINCREHISVLGHTKRKYSMQSLYYSGEAELITFLPEEILGTKLRALYQRKKGRDLYDLYQGCIKLKPKVDELLECYYEYIRENKQRIPSRKEYIKNIEEKINDPEFTGDTKALLREGEEFSYEGAYKKIFNEILTKMQ